MALDYSNVSATKLNLNKSLVANQIDAQFPHPVADARVSRIPDLRSSPQARDPGCRRDRAERYRLRIAMLMKRSR